ncbi:MAG: L-rhamnose mutarotase [Bythopirellula sp.]
MKSIALLLLLGLGVSSLLALSSHGDHHGKSDAPKIKRIGMVVGIDPGKIPEYKRLHAHDYAGVRDLLSKYHMKNFNIFLQEMPDGKWYEFGYYEYHGKNFEADMALLDKEPRNIEWLKVCDPMQIPLPGATGWTEMERVYFNE